jgi:flagellar basal body-associated protein FliL
LSCTLSLPAVSNVHPSSDTAIEVRDEKCLSNVAKHFFAKRSQTLTVASALPEKSCKKTAKKERLIQQVRDRLNN